MDDLKRIFFHELGHFIANEINLQYYHGTGTKSITIYPASHNNELFVGEAKINSSPDGKERNAPSKDHLAEYLASSSYGCIFQAYHTGKGFDECFKINGQDDEQKWYSSLREHKLEDYRSELTAAERDFFKRLEKEKLLDEIMEIDPGKYLMHIGQQNYTVDLDQLRKDSSVFIEKHSSAYASLIKMYNEIIAKYLK